MNLYELMGAANKEELENLNEQVFQLSPNDITILLDVEDKESWLQIQRVDYPTLRSLRMIVEVIRNGA